MLNRNDVFDLVNSYRRYVSTVSAIKQAALFKLPDGRTLPLDHPDVQAYFREHPEALTENPQ